MRSKFFVVVLLGLGLRDSSDVDLLKAVREDHQHSVVISMAAPDRVAAAVECLKAGVSCYVAKPVNVGKLLATIQVALEKQCLVPDVYLDLASRCGVLRAFTKPVDREDLLAGVREALAA